MPDNNNSCYSASPQIKIPFPPSGRTKTLSEEVLELKVLTQKLMVEVKLLRAEVAQLKEILLKD